MQEICDRVFTEFASKKLFRLPDQWPDYIDPTYLKKAEEEERQHQMKVQGNFNPSGKDFYDRVNARARSKIESDQQKAMADSMGRSGSAGSRRDSLASTSTTLTYQKDPEAQTVLTKPMIVEIFEFLEVYLSQKDVGFLFDQIDEDNSGTIDPKEWRQFFCKAKYRNDMKMRASLKDFFLRELFDEFDLSDRGFLVFDDLLNIVRFMNLSMTDEVVKRLFSKIDSSGDDKIQLEEFLGFFVAIQNQAEMKERLHQYKIKKERSVYIHAGYSFVFLLLFIICLLPSVAFTEGAIFSGIAFFGFFMMFLGVDRVDKITDFIRMNMMVLTIARFRMFTVVVGVGLVAIVIVAEIERATMKSKRLAAGTDSTNQKIPDALVYALIGIFIGLVVINIVAYLEREKGCLRVIFLGEEYEWKTDDGPYSPGRDRFDKYGRYSGDINTGNVRSPSAKRIASGLFGMSPRNKRERNREYAHKEYHGGKSKGYGGYGGDYDKPLDGYTDYNINENDYMSSHGGRNSKKSRGGGRPSSGGHDSVGDFSQFDRRRAIMNIKTSLPPPLKQPKLLHNRGVLGDRIASGLRRFGSNITHLMSPKSSPKSAQYASQETAYNGFKIQQIQHQSNEDTVIEFGGGSSARGDGNRIQGRIPGRSSSQERRGSAENELSFEYMAQQESERTEMKAQQRYSATEKWSSANREGRKSRSQSPVKGELQRGAGGHGRNMGQEFTDEENLSNDPRGMSTGAVLAGGSRPVSRGSFSAAQRPPSQGRPWSQGAQRVEAFQPLSSEGARPQIARASKSGSVGSMGIYGGTIE